MSLTVAEKAVLSVLERREHGGHFLNPDWQDVLKSLAMKGLVSDVYELGDGSMKGHINMKGRAALADARVAE